MPTTYAADYPAINRDNQKIDTIYVVMQRQMFWDGPFRDFDDETCFVTPDGEGRLFTDSLAEAKAEYGDLPVRRIALTWEP